MKTFKQYLIEYKDTSTEFVAMRGDDFVTFEISLNWKELGVKESDFELITSFGTGINKWKIVFKNKQFHTVRTKIRQDTTNYIYQVIGRDLGRHIAINKGIKIIEGFLRLKKQKVEWPRDTRIAAEPIYSQWKGKIIVPALVSTNKKSEIINNSQIIYEIAIIAPKELVRFFKPWAGELRRYAEGKL